MPPSKHAILSASSSHRWLNCSPSARLEQEFDDRETQAAAEGTAAHAAAALRPPHVGVVHGRAAEPVDVVLDAQSPQEAVLLLDGQLWPELEDGVPLSSVAVKPEKDFADGGGFLD